MRRSTADFVQIETRRLHVSKLYLQGKGQHEIAALMTTEFRKPGDKPISQQTISQDLKAVRQQWRSSAVRNFDAAQEMELARIDQVEKEAWAAWQRTIGKIKTIKNEDGVGANGSIDKTTEIIKRQAGDPRFLQIVQDCIRQRREMLGLDAPRKVNLVNEHMPENMPDSELEKAILQTADALKTGIMVPGNRNGNGNGNGNRNGIQ